MLLMYSVDEIKYDIQNVAFAQGDVARVHDNYGHDLLGDRGENYMHQWKDVCEDGNWDRVKRMIDLALSDVEQMLYRFTATVLPMNGISLDNEQCCERKEYVLELKVTKEFSATSADYLLKLIHEYVIDSVLEDWASLTYPEAVTMWSAKKQETNRKILHASHYRMDRPMIKPSII